MEGPAEHRFQQEAKTERLVNKGLNTLSSVSLQSFFWGGGGSIPFDCSTESKMKIKRLGYNNYKLNIVDATTARSRRE